MEAMVKIRSKSVQKQRNSAFFLEEFNFRDFLPLCLNDGKQIKLVDDNTDSLLSEKDQRIMHWKVDAAAAAA